MNKMSEFAKKRRKMIYLFLSVIVVVGMVGSLFWGAGSLMGSHKSKAASANKDNMIVATVKKAPFGALVNAQLTSDGENQYKDAKKFQVYNDKGKPVSAPQVLGKDTTVFPVVSANIIVTIKILDENNKVIDTLKTKLKK